MIATAVKLALFSTGLVTKQLIVACIVFQSYYLKPKPRSSPVIHRLVFKIQHACITRRDDTEALVRSTITENIKIE